MALETGAPVIPVGISLEYSRLQFIENVIKGEREVGAWYFRGPYAMTVGRPMVFTGDANDRELVRVVTGQIMNQVGRLSHQGRLRLALGQFPRKGVLPRMTRWAVQAVALRAIEWMMLFVIAFPRGV